MLIWHRVAWQRRMHLHLQMRRTIPLPLFSTLNSPFGFIHQALHCNTEGRVLYTQYCIKCVSAELFTYAPFSISSTLKAHSIKGHCGAECIQIFSSILFQHKSMRGFQRLDAGYMSRFAPIRTTCWQQPSRCQARVEGAHISPWVCNF